MLTPLILFLGLTVATAIIAYWSDNLGKKLGKKRVSLFGLRPRTTATILTITSSWAIMLFTLAVLLIVVTPLRRALFRYDSDRAKYRDDINRAEGRLTEVRGRLEEAQSSVKSTQDKLVNTQASLKQARFEVESARQEGENAKTRAADAQAGEKKALAGVSAAQKRVSEAQRRYTEAQRRYNEAQRQFEAAQGRAEMAQQRQKVAQQGQAEAEQQAIKARDNLGQAREQLDTAREKLSNVQQRLHKARGELAKVQRDYKSTKRNYENAKKSLANADQSFIRISNQILSLDREIAGLRIQRDRLGGSNISIPVGRTFSAGIIEAGKSQKRIEENLRQLLEKGRQALPSLGTPPNSTLNLLPLPEMVKGEVKFIEGDAIFERLAQEIASSEEPTSVRLVAMRNFVIGETQFDARFVAVKVATAFRAGEVLATIDIDGTSGDAAIFRRLQDLTDLGVDVAIERNVNPPQSPQEQYFYASGTNVAIFAVLRRIEATRKTVRVKLVAADDLSTVEPLRVRFEIEGEETATTGQ